MLPLFDDDRRRRINLGGASSASTHTAILDQAKARRTERLENKRRQENAVRLQAWWRGLREARLARREMRQAFENDLTGITGLRCLVLIGRDDDVLGKWSSTMVERGEGTLFELATGPYRQNWFVLIRQAASLLLRSVADSPQSQYAVTYLKILSLLLSSAATTRVLGPQGLQLSVEITQYLMNRGLYPLLSKAITAIPLESKSSPSLPLLIPLVTLPLSTFSISSPSYSQCLSLLFSDILTLPLLPNRLPFPTLTHLSSHLPLATLHLLDPSIPALLTAITTESKIHLVANLLAFTPPRYAKLPSPALGSYLLLLTSLLNALPINALDPPAKRGSTTLRQQQQPWDSDSDSEDASPTRISVVSTFTPMQALPELDARTLKRLRSLPTPAHLNALLTASQSHPSTRPNLVSFFLALNSVWPVHRDRVLSTVLVYTGGGLLRELYRGYVRGSPIGRDDNPGALMDPAHAASWPPLLFLADLYTQSLLTMGDDEFFGTTSNASQRNPLTLDELTSFSRQLLNIAFMLYWREDQTNVQEGGVSGAVRFTWEGVREKVTKCLLGIHARDSRKPFMPTGHWLVSSQIDMQTFVEAAVYEEQQLSLPTNPPSRLLSKRQIAYMSPRLGILNNIPFAIPFEVRVSIFRHFVVSDMASQGVNRFVFHGRGNKTRVQVRRGSVAQDGFDRLAEANMKAPVEITFIDQFGQEEAGIDGGGVFKEFFTSLCKEVFDTDRGLWLANKKNELYPNPHAYATESHSLNWYRFIGRILGKALYEGILVDVAFAGFFLAKWLGKQSFLDDLSSLDPDLYNGLIFLKHYNGNPEELSLNFTVAVEEFGLAKTLDLIPNGSNIAVTRENRLQYIHLVSHYRLSKQIKFQSEAFFEGLSEMIDPKWLRMFNQQEVQILLGGVNSPVDLDDLRKNTNYGGLYDDNESTITAFWNVVNSFDQEQCRALLRFVTSCSRPPLLGFKELVPNFAIRDAGSDEHRLPTSSTCVNLLKLPRYKSEKTLREKLLQAITAGAGFDLS